MDVALIVGRTIEHRGPIFCENGDVSARYRGLMLQRNDEYLAAMIGVSLSDNPQIRN